jgi:hypothetical protein
MCLFQRRLLRLFVLIRLPHRSKRRRVSIRGFSSLCPLCYHRGVGRECGVGRGPGVTLGVEVAVGVAVGVELGVAVAVAVGVGVGPDCAQYLPPLFK